LQFESRFGRTAMFESIVQSLLEKYIGAFVKDFAQQDLKIGLLKGWFFEIQMRTSIVSHF
jgi:hypothetical protein